MKVLVNGCAGFMGKELIKLLGEDYFAGVDSRGDIKRLEDAPKGADLIIDFSNHACTFDLLKYAKDNKLPIVLATTGQTQEEKDAITEASKEIPIFFAANYSIGVTLLVQLAKKTAAAMPDAEIEIIEAHHDRKLDAPSGTALAIANGIKEVRPNAFFNCGRNGQCKRNPDEIGINSIRLGNIVGDHEVMIGTQNETITLKHQAHSRSVFADGAIAAARWLMGKAAGLYDMNSMIKF